MKKVMMTILIMVVVVLTSSLAEAQHTVRRGHGRYGGYGRYGYYGRDRNTVLDYVYSGMDLFRMLDQSSMAKKEQRFRHQQVRNWNSLAIRPVIRTVIRTVRRPVVVLQVEKPEQTQSQESQELQQRIRILELELQKLELQQQAKK